LIQRAKKGGRKMMKRRARMRSAIPGSAGAARQGVSASAVTSLSGLIGRFCMGLYLEPNLSGALQRQRTGFDSMRRGIPWQFHEET
jgi:hypothetical protein